MGPFIVLLLLLVVLALYLANRSRSSAALYSDKGIASKVFFDHVRNIKAKPDRLEGTREMAKLLEFKSRESRVYQSDIVQALASVLAARVANKFSPIPPKMGNEIPSPTFKRSSPKGSIYAMGLLSTYEYVFGPAFNPIESD